MKKLILFIAVISATCIGYNANAQVSVNINIGTQPLWGPTGYDYVQYYYIPDMDAYYSVDQQTYTYLVNGQWVTTMEMPPMYRNYDLYNGYKVVINEPRPWLHEARYHQQYAQYRGRHGQPFIRDSRNSKYYANPQHPQHAQWNNGHNDNNHGNNGHMNHGNHPVPVTNAPVQVNQGSTRPGTQNGPQNHGNGNQNHDNHGQGHEEHGNGHGHDDHGGHR